MLADAAARLDVAGVGMAVAGAGNALGQRTVVLSLASETRGATLAKLPDVTVGTNAPFNESLPTITSSSNHPPRASQLDIVDLSFLSPFVVDSELDGGQIGEQRLELQRRQFRRPLEVGVFAESEGVVSPLGIRQFVPLGENRCHH